MSKPFVLALAASALLAAPLAAPTAASAQPASQSCLRLSSISGQHLVDAHTLYLRSGRRVFRISFGAGCNSSPNETLVLHPFSNGDSVCKPIELDVHVRATGERCIADSLTELTPDEIAALPRDQRP